MSEHEKFAAPHEIEEILDRLPPQVTLHVPDHILSLWFPPGPANGVMEGRALARAQLRQKLRLRVRVSRRPRWGRLLQGDTVGRLTRKGAEHVLLHCRSQTSVLRMRALRRSIATTVTTTMMI